LLRAFVGIVTVGKATDDIVMALNMTFLRGEEQALSSVKAGVVDTIASIHLYLYLYTPLYLLYKSDHDENLDSPLYD
jgi:hypothetical protein